MKKNILLTIILASLITFAFFWEQQGNKEKYISEEKLQKLFTLQTNDILELSFKNVEVLKGSDGKWAISSLNYPASAHKIDFILKTLNGLAIIAKIDLNKQNSKEFFVHQDHQFKIRTVNKEILMRLGDISNVTGYFYLEVSENNMNSLYLIKDDNFYEGLYKNAVEAEFQKYLAFKKIITTAPKELIENKLLPHINIENIDKLTIKRKSRPLYEVDLKAGNTKPAIYKDLKYKNIINFLQNIWGQVNVQSISKKENNILSGLLSTIELDLDGEKIELTLFGKFNDEVGNFLTVSNSDWVYFIAEEGKDLFFLDVQDFWQKKFIYEKPIAKYESFEFKLGQANNLYSLKVGEISKFEIESNDDRIDSLRPSNLNLLFNLMFNLVNFSESKFVYDNLKRLDKKTPVFDLVLFGKTFKFQFKKYLIIVQDIDLGLEYHFVHQNHSIFIDALSDFFTLNQKKK